MVKKQKYDSAGSLTQEQREEFTRIAKQLISDMGERLPTDNWDPLSHIVETPIVDVIPDGHVIVRDDFNTKQYTQPRITLGKSSK